jgi:modulator of FtsH protease
MDRKFEPVMSGQPTRPRTPVFDGTVAPPLAQNNVLRNTYWLLALSMLPTIAGRIRRRATQFLRAVRRASDRDTAAHVRRHDGHAVRGDSAAQQRVGHRALFGFTFVAGLMLTPILTVAGGFRNGWQLVGLAGAMTAAIFFTMAAVATVSKRDFSGMGRFLMVGTVVLIVASSPTCSSRSRR